MASQSQRVRRNISPKQGPLKATLPISLMQQNSSYSPTSNIKKDSPTKSPIFLSRTEVPKFINRHSPEERLFSAYQNKVVDGGIRRAASLDALAQSMVDHSTQTPEEWDDVKMKVIPEQLEKKFIRQRLRSGHRSTTLQHTSPVPADHSAVRPLLTPRSLLRSSLEGLNQEIEKLVLKGYSGGLEGEPDLEKIPDGHRAPVLELATPSSTGSSRSHSLSPLVASDWYLLSSATGGGGVGGDEDPDHTKLGTSPHINTFLAREPPDGCERVKILEEPYRAPDSGPSHPLLSSFILLPSQSSAFIPLPRDFPRP